MSLIVEMESPRSIPILKNIKELTGIESYEDTLNYALAVLQWAARQHRRGRIVVALDRDGSYTKLRMAPLERAGQGAQEATAAVDLKAVAQPIRVCAGQR